MKKLLLVQLLCMALCRSISASAAAMPENAPLSNIFRTDEKEFIMLDYKDKKFLVMGMNDSGKCAEEDIESALTVTDSMKKYVPKEVFIPDEEMLSEYPGLIGKNDGITGGMWKIYSNPESSCDISRYLRSAAVKTETGILDFNILRSPESVSALESSAETVISFTVPKSGAYDISFGGNTSARLTMCEKNDLFDTKLLDSSKGGNGIEVSVSAKSGSRINLHLLSQTEDVQFDYILTGDQEVYSIADCDLETEGWWIKSEDENKVLSMYTGEVMKSSGKGEYVRPAFWLPERFFLDNKLNLSEAGDGVLALLRSAFGSGELGKIYDADEVETILNKAPNEFKILPYDGADGETGTLLKNDTDLIKRGNFYVAGYKDGKMLSVEKKSFAIPPRSDAAIIAAADSAELVRQFLWEDMKPIKETGKRELPCYRLKDIKKGKEGQWSFYKKSVSETDFSKYTELSFGSDGAIKGDAGLPVLQWIGKYEGYPCVRSESDTSGSKYVTNNQGSMVICFTIPYSGNWKIDFKYKNVGLDVIGGDGGYFNFSYLPKNQTEDVRVFKKIDGGVSTCKPKWDNYENVIYAEGGDKIMLSLDPKNDGYADRWVIDYNISETEEKGNVIYEDYEKDKRSKPPASEKEQGTEAENVNVWIGMSSISDSAAMQDTILYLKKYIPNMGIVSFQGYPEENSNADFFKENNIPVMIQNFGTDYADYIEENDAWEYSYRHIPMNSEDNQKLSGTGHAFALPHSAVREVFGRVIKSTAKSGYSSFGYADCVWDWGAYGKAGYNSQTVKAFSEDLCGTDEGIRVNGEKTGFWDYFAYYTGGETLLPEDFRFKSWEEYQPIDFEEWQRRTRLGISTDYDYALMDMLCHYELLKFMQFIGDRAAENGIKPQIMVNAEFFPNGVDLLFLNRLNNMYFTDEEFFGDTDFLDGAYYRHNYLIKNAKDNGINPGGIMEAGSGGNDGAYYEPEIAYASAAELGLLGTVEHLEADFLYPNRLDFISGISAMRTRNESILSYAMGFDLGKSLGLEKRESDFACISSRVHLKQWSYSSEYKPWSSRLDFDDNTDFILSKMGYNFDGISQEGILDSKLPKTVVYAPKIATQAYFEKLLSLLGNGSVKNVIMSAGRMEKTVMPDMKLKGFAEENPDFAFDTAAQDLSGGIVKTTSGSFVSGSRYSVSGNIYEPKKGDTTVLTINFLNSSYPLLVKRNIGSSTIYIMLFDSDNRANYALSEAVYGWLLSQLGISPMYKNVSDSGELTAEYSSTEAYAAKVEKDLGVSVRVYENGEITAVGIQNSRGRFMAEKNGKNMIPYELTDSVTAAKVKLVPNKQYSYIQIPSGIRGEVTADNNGYASLSFNNTSHEIFVMADDTTLDSISEKLALWREAVQFDLPED